jgi:hypothetical protein
MTETFTWHTTQCAFCRSSFVMVTAPPLPGGSINAEREVICPACEGRNFLITPGEVQETMFVAGSANG